MKERHQKTQKMMERLKKGRNQRPQKKQAKIQAKCLPSIKAKYLQQMKY